MVCQRRSAPGNKQLAAQQPDALEHRLSQRILLGRAQRLAREAGDGRLDGRKHGRRRKADEIVAKINALEGYKAQFQKVFQSDATADNVMKAIAAYERTIISGNTAWDRWKAGDQTAISQSACRGWNIFQAIKCNNCHDGVLFTDQQYHNVGIGMDQKEPDVGRFKVTNKPEDTGAFKTPTLRDIAKSAPYFHDGSAKTLEEAVDIMLAGGKPNQYLDKKNLQPHKILAGAARGSAELPAVVVGGLQLEQATAAAEVNCNHKDTIGTIFINCVLVPLWLKMFTPARFECP